MKAPADQTRRQGLDRPRAFDITEAKARLCAADGGYELVHKSTLIEIRVYTLIAPEPDHERINEDDEIYIVLEGRGALDVGGEQLELREGHAAFIPAGANHWFSSYEHLTVLAIQGTGGHAMTEGSSAAACTGMPSA
jgi:mannose-6-phosphate isomerase-like protein (cupin superfamily)